MTDYQIKQLTKRVEVWQKRLEHLGLAHYRIEGITVEENPSGVQSANAAVIPSNNYDSAWFSFREEFVDEAFDSKDFEKLDETIIHEWMHVAFNPYCNDISLVHDYLAPMVAGIWEDAMEASGEQLVERLARQLYSAFKSDMVQ